MKPTVTRHTLLAAGFSLGLVTLPAMAADAEMESTRQTPQQNQQQDARPESQPATGETAMRANAMEDNREDQQMAADAKKDKAPSLAETQELIAAIQPVNSSNVRGSVLFEKVSGGVKVTAKVGGLEPNSKHGIHIHQYGDITADDGTSAGGHYNPDGHEHALPSESRRHAGDFGNLEADADGNATLELTVDNISLTGDKNPIVGRAVIIHAQRDDGSQPSGNAGDRIGAGVIGIGSAEPEPGDESAMAE